MSVRTTLARCAAVALSLAVFAHPAGATPKVEHWVLDSGVRVYYVHAPQIPMVDIALKFDAGGVRSPDKAGLADFTAHMLKAGADGMSLEEIAMRLEDLGANLSTPVGREAAGLSLRSLTDAEVFEKAAALLIRVISKPDFPERHFKRKKKSRLASLAAQKQNIRSVLGRRFNQLAYGDHPYARPLSGEHDTIVAISLDDIKRFYKKYYVANNLTMIVVGDIGRLRVEQLANELARVLPTGETPPPLPPVKPLTAAITENIPHPSQQVHVKIGQPFIKAGHPDFYALHLGNYILGGGGFGSRIMEEIRVKRGLAYSSHSHFRTRREAGLFTVSFQTRADQKDLAISVARNVLTDFIDNGPTEEEVESARLAMLGGLPMRFASNSSILSGVARIALFGLPVDYLAAFGPSIERVTRDEIIAAWRRHLNPDALVTLVVGGAEN